MTPCCLCRCVNDVKPREFDLRDIYQQLEIVPKRGRFTARSVAPDGIPPWLLRRKHWRLYASKPKEFDLTEATGLDKALRARMPELDAAARLVTVGRWYAPCVFVKEGGASLHDQMARSAYYEIALQQLWEEVYACENSHGDRREVKVEATVRGEEARLGGGKEARRDDARGDGVVWFEAMGSAAGERVGLSSATWERMRREGSRGGGEAKVERVEECGGPWRRFGCYVLVERFAVRRMDGSLALTVDFKHTDTIRSMWE